MIKYTLRLFLWLKKKDSNDLCPVSIALTIKRKVAIFQTPYKVRESDWDDDKKIIRSSYTNSGKINALLKKQMSEIDTLILNKSLAGKPVAADQVKREYRGGGDFVDFLKYAEDIKKDRPQSERPIYTKEINRLRNFSPSISFTDIDAAFLRKYEAHERKRGIEPNTINAEFKWLRRVLNYAKDEGLIDSSPFENFSMVRYVQSERIFLEEHERNQFVKYWKEKKVSGSLYITLTYFLLGVFTGLRHSDWHSAKERVYGDLLRLRPQKTKKKGQWVVLPIGPTLKSIFQVIETLPAPFSGDKSREHLKIIAGRLDIDKNITTHSARHSFGTMCAENKIPKSVAAELMGITVKAVDIYFHLTGENIREQAAALALI